jgi:hypothetical protein
MKNRYKILRNKKMPTVHLINVKLGTKGHVVIYCGTPKFPYTIGKRIPKVEWDINGWKAGYKMDEIFWVHEKILN